MEFKASTSVTVCWPPAHGLVTLVFVQFPSVLPLSRLKNSSISSDGTVMQWLAPISTLLGESPRFQFWSLLGPFCVRC